MQFTSSVPSGALALAVPIQNKNKNKNNLKLYKKFKYFDD